MIRCWFDGACADNGNINAETGIGFAIDTGEDIIKISRYGGKGTNNTAEYKALIGCLEKLLELGLDEKEIEIYGDSNLIIKQVNGEWKCNKEHLIPFKNHAQQLKGLFANLTIKWVKREKNQIADNLSKKGLNGKEEESKVKKSNEQESSKMEIIGVGDGIYKVISDSGNVYVVDLNRQVCSCPDNQYRHNECKHIRYIKSVV